MKTLIIILTTTLFILNSLITLGYCQSYNVYQIEYGTFCDGRPHRDSISKTNDCIDLSYEAVTVHKNYQRYHFFEDLEMRWIDEHIYTSKSRFIDSNQELGILTYWYNKFVGTRLIQIEYSNNYYRYYFK